MKRLILGIIALSFASPAWAGAKRPVLPPNPVTNEMRVAVTKDFNAVMNCVGSRVFEVRATGDLTKFEAANNAAGIAASEGNVSQFQSEAAIVASEAVRLKPKYCG